MIPSKLSTGLLLLFMLSVSEIATADSILDDKDVWIHGKDRCSQGLHKQPNGPMALLMFCDDALGVNAGLVYYDSPEEPVSIQFYNKLSEEEKKTYYNIWSLSNRMWQDQIWGSDITSYAWSPDGTRLFIATSEIYGSGALYELDLIRKKYKQVAPADRVTKLNNSGPGYIITTIDKNKSKLIYVLDPQSDEPLEGLPKLFYKLE